MTGDHFESFQQQRSAANLGMWIFLGSELMLFAGLFSLYASYRSHYPLVFSEGIAENNRALDSLNTVVLITSSYVVAMALHELRAGRPRACLYLIGLTLALGTLFLIIKGTEYAEHFRAGIFPGGHGHFFQRAGTHQAIAIYFTLYYVMTGLHAIHVIAGMAVLSVMGAGVLRGHITESRDHHLELGALYWHLVDIVWIFLWPMFYLMRSV